MHEITYLSFFKQNIRIYSYFLANFIQNLLDLFLELKLFHIVFKQFDNQPFFIFR